VLEQEMQVKKPWDEPQKLRGFVLFTELEKNIN